MSSDTLHFERTGKIVLDCVELSHENYIGKIVQSMIDPKNYTSKLVNTVTQKTVDVFSGTLEECRNRVMDEMEFRAYVDRASNATPTGRLLQVLWENNPNPFLKNEIKYHVYSEPLDHEHIKTIVPSFYSTKLLRETIDEAGTLLYLEMDGFISREFMKYLRRIDEWKELPIRQ